MNENVINHIIIRLYDRKEIIALEVLSVYSFSAANHVLSNTSAPKQNRENKKKDEEHLSSIRGVHPSLSQ